MNILCFLCPGKCPFNRGGCFFFVYLMQKFAECRVVMMYEITVNIRTYYIEINIFQDKAKMNAGNKYNDNFFGLYCICKRPYPDPEDEVGDLGLTLGTVSPPAFTPQAPSTSGPL